jgi:hypothetical protein
MSVPSLNASRFHVWLDQPDHPEADPDGVVYREVLVRSGDQLRAELEQNKLRLPGLKEAPLHATALWIWGACARLGYTEATAQPFITTELVSYRPLDQGVVPVDPTDPPSSSGSG